jgi:quinol monooxygenase YgiN
MLKVVAKNYADLNQLDKILSLCRELVEITRGEKGCISYGVYHDVEHPELLTMIEEWKSREDLDAHLHAEHFTRIVPQLGKLMTQASDMNVYEQII